MICYLLFITLIELLTCVSKSEAKLTKIKYYIDDKCDPDEFRWQSVDNDVHQFLYCDMVSKTLKINQCPKVNEIRLWFDKEQSRCVGPRMRNKRTPYTTNSANLGEGCRDMTDCKTNMFCPNGLCACLPAYVGVQGSASCLPVANPGQPCSQTIQCAGGWPGATCSTSNVCACPASYTAFQTQDGYVCAKVGFCPLPDYTGTPPTGNYIDQLVISTTASTCKYLSGDDGTGASAAAANYCDSPANTYQGDMYDCIPATAVTAPNTDGICCPSRALTCIQPKMVAASPPTGSIENRYWYNSITGGCESFPFDNGLQKGNSNSFLTLDFCLSYCGSACKHGPPKLTSPPTAGTANQVTICTSDSNCPAISTITLSSYTCQQTGVTRTCCAAKSFICTLYGGRQYYGTAKGQTVPTTSDVGVASNPALTSPLNQRWYYDSTSQTCVSFTYSGLAGNWNNFLSQTDCQTTCISSACDQGSPLKTSLGANQACSGTSGSVCPSTYECKSNVCCPRRQTVCIEPKSPGTCSSTIAAYWFNAATSDCESFTYTGCGGNDNNFQSYTACISYCRNIGGQPRCVQGDADKDSTGKYLTCSSGTTSTCRANFECYFDGTLFGCCPIQSYTCQLQRSLGTVCITGGPRWNYDTTTRTCQPFTYNGCDGNSNNFISRDDCERYCGAGGCPYGGQPYVDTATSTRRVCSAATTCPTSYECQTITIATSLQNACCYSRLAICQLSPLQGSTSGVPVTRYYFSTQTRTCQTFTFFGSSGNLNNFATLSQCTNFCASSACSLGETVAIDQSTQRVQTCNQQVTTSCSVGYQCRQDILFNRFVCCGSTDMGVCPQGEKAYIDAFTQAPRECRVGVIGDCYTNFLCRPNTNRNRNYCCAPSASSYCPAGRGVGRDASLNPQSCFISTVNTCSSGYSCQSPLTGQVQGFCCTINPLCPNNGNFATDASQNPVVCTIPTSTTAVNPCSSGFTCQTTTTGSTTGYCCSTAPTTAACGTLTPVIDPATTTARICSATAPCPTGSCTLNVQSGISYCCQQSIGGVDPDGCGVGLFAYREPATSVIRQCAIGPGSNCPTGFSCQFSTTTNQNQCCGLSAGCPSNSAAYINSVTGNAQSCATGGTPCPNAFACTTTTTGSVCCSTGQPIVTTPGPTTAPPTIPPTIPPTVPPTTVRCPLATQTPYIPAGSTTPQRCNPGACPANYVCVNNGQQFICCSTQASMCPSGSIVATNTATGAPINCMTATCPSGYRCTYSASYRWYFCCSGGGTVNTVAPSTSGCPAGQQPYFTPGSPTPARCTQGITSGTGACPTPYACTFSTTYSTTICCQSASFTGGNPVVSTGSGCPGGSSAYLYPGTSLPLTCTGLGDGRCPTGHRCAVTTNGSFQCCSG